MLYEVITHKNFTPDQQADEVRKVKKFEAGMVLDPITMFPDETLGDILKLKNKHNVSA